MSTKKIAVYSKEALGERDYWVAKLSSERQTSNIILDYERPDTYAGEKALVEITLPQDTAQKLLALAGNSAFLIYAALLAALKVCIHQYTGSTHIVVGSPARKKSEVLAERPNAVALIDEVIDSMSYRQLLLNVRETLLQSYAKQSYPFAALLRDMELDHIQNRCPLFDIALAFKGIHSPLPDLKNDITMTLARQDETISGQAEFNSNLFTVDSVSNFINHYLQVLSEGLADTDAPISSLSMITKAEQERILLEWNDTGSLHKEANVTVDRLFEEQVKHRPLAVALAFGSETLKFQELNRRANRLARYITQLGAGPEVIVGVYLDRSIEMVVSLLAILKAGAAYVPLNPKHPKDRVSFILGDTKTPVVLTSEALAATLPEHEASIVRLDADAEAIACESDEDLHSRATVDNLVYVIYTSGSTGRPKGVQVTHRGLANLVREQRAGFKMEPDSRVLQFASLSFDASASEIFVTLLSGATLCIASQDSLLPGPGLVRLLREREITIVTLPPSLLMAVEKDELPSLRTLVVAGEPCPAKLVKSWCQEVRFINAYGPTEATVCATMAHCKEFERKPPIGRPIADTQVYILDSGLRCVPTGVPGEVHIAGIGLARGYLNRPDLTAEKFLPNPFSSHPGARLYKTGDQARYLPDGNIEFLGRIDYQVKLRGFRIEPGEIEENLRLHRSIQDAVVAAREDTPGNRRLVAYVVLKADGNQGQEPAESKVIPELRTYLQEKLPEYMIPAAFVILDEFPLTVSGKIDRRALPAPRQTRADLAQEYIAPRTNTESVLADIWAEALGLEQVGVNDNFFELGGHSLMVPEVMFGVQKVFKMELPLRVLFEAPTLVGLAEAVDLASREGVGALDSLNFDQLEAESVLESAISPEGLPYTFPADPSGIFLTGATGFVGAFLLKELLDQTKAEIYCLVRADDSRQASERIRAKLEDYQLWEPGLDARIIPVVGDLAKPLFGLSEEEFEFLAAKADVIYHGGAAVSFFEPFYRLKATNIGGTQEALRLATRVKMKPVHYISTLSVFSATADGYSGTKWVAEKIVTIARDRGLPVCIYRPGFVTGDTEKGVWNLGDMMSRIIKGSIQLTKSPELGVMVDMTPVDYLCKAIWFLSKQEKSLGKAFHVVNPRRLHVTRIVEFINALGYPVEEVPYNDWAADLFSRTEKSRDNALYPLLPIFPERVTDDPHDHEVHRHDPRYFQEEVIKRDRKITDEALAESDLVCPSVADLLGTYFSYFRTSGYLESPPSGQ